jgi:hypothetical protein
VRGQQVSFDPLGQEFRGARLEAQAEPRCPGRYPLRQAADLDRLRLDDDAVLVERLEPGARPGVLSGRVVTTSSRLSGPGSAASAASTAPPSLPGRGVGMRTSRMRRSANSDSVRLATLTSASRSCDR